MFLGDAIRREREAQKGSCRAAITLPRMSQKTLAELADISEREVVRIERRQVNPHPDTLDRITAALELKPGFFAVWTSVPPKRAAMFLADWRRRVAA